MGLGGLGFRISGSPGSTTVHLQRGVMRTNTFELRVCPLPLRMGKDLNDTVQTNTRICTALNLYNHSL